MSLYENNNQNVMTKYFEDQNLVKRKLEIFIDTKKLISPLIKYDQSLSSGNKLFENRHKILSSAFSNSSFKKNKINLLAPLNWNLQS